MVDMGRRLTVFVAVAAALVLALCADPAWSQPPVARPQPPPKAPGAETGKTPATPSKPAVTAQPAPGQPGTAPAGAPSAGSGEARTPAGSAPAAAAAPAAPKPAATEALTTEPPPTEAYLGVPVLPGSQFIGSYDAGGAGQRFYLFGTVRGFAEVVGYYRTVLKQKGELVFEIPATHMFEVGKFREDQVAFPPGVTVKDYTAGGSPGLANPKFGAAPAAFPTVIQIVPPAAAPAARPR